ncbi:MAG: hypothetical protein ACRDN0_32290 [Trebonia sp.]
MPRDARRQVARKAASARHKYRDQNRVAVDPARVYGDCVPRERADGSPYGERAETYLRLLAESVLHPLRPDRADRVRRAASTLVEAGVLTAAQASWILLDLTTALRARGKDEPLWSGQRLRHLAGFLPQSPVAAGEEWRVVPVHDAEPAARLMALVIMADRVLAPATFRLPPSAGIPDLQLPPWADLSAADDAGTAYRLTFANGTWAGSTWTGTIMLYPAPPATARTLTIISPNGPLCLIRLSPAKIPPGEAAATEDSPGERLLTRHAEALLTSLSADGALGLAREEPGLAELAGMLEDAGALSPLSPVPPRVAALYQLLGLPAEGSPGDIPARWLTVITHYGRRRPLPPASGTASIGVALPELDGARLVVAGLRSGEPGSFLHVVARGLRPLPHRSASRFPNDWGLARDAGFSWWFRDDAGGWHLGAIEEALPVGGDVVLRLALLPSLAHATTTLTAEVTGVSRRVTTTFPLRW